jgi:TIR domain
VKRKYHVALSFAGEDRDYVQRVASKLVSEGVEVFYDEFEEAALWGKNLYAHLRDVYENKALFTVMFISEHYKSKVWTNHERESAQARALESNQEYILPAFFDTSVKVPGLPKTIGHISLLRKTPEEFAEVIVKKLQQSGVELSAEFAYSEDAKADVDFPHPPGTKVGAILNDLKSHTWPTQAPAVDATFKLDWKSLNKNEIFVLGRNIYQCACGSEWKALEVVSNLREKLAGLPERAAAHLLNGMFYEVYFDKEGQFRGNNLKGECLDELLEVQKVKRFEASISFIRHALEPYKSRLLFLPSTTPDIVTLSLFVKLSDPPELKSVKFKGTELLKRIDEDADLTRHAWKLWKLGHTKFTVKQFKELLCEAWSIPPEQLDIKFSHKMDSDTHYRLPKGFSLAWPEQGT